MSIIQVMIEFKIFCLVMILFSFSILQCIINSQNNESDHFSSIIRLCPKYPENETVCALFGGFLNENPDQHFLHTISNR